MANPRSRVTPIITDAYNDPLLDPRPAPGTNYRSVMRTNVVDYGWTTNDNHG